MDFRIKEDICPITKKEIRTAEIKYKQKC